MRIKTKADTPTAAGAGEVRSARARNTLARQASAALGAELGGFDGPLGHHSLDDILGMIDWTSNTPHAGSALEQALGVGKEIPDELLPALKTGLTPKGPLTIDEVWRLCEQPNGAHASAPEPRGGVSVEGEAATAGGSTPVSPIALVPDGSSPRARALAKTAEASGRANRAKKRTQPDYGSAGSTPTMGGGERSAFTAAVKTMAEHKFDAALEEEEGYVAATVKRAAKKPKKAGGGAAKGGGGGDEISQRVMNNRASARRSRDRKLKYVADLEEKCVSLESENEQLKQRVAALEARLR